MDWLPLNSFPVGVEGVGRLIGVAFHLGEETLQKEVSLPCHTAAVQC